MTVERPQVPTDERKPAWRRACLVYSAWRLAGASEQKAREAAVAAVQTVLRLPWNEASVEAMNAVAYASSHEPAWFWRGAKQTEKWRAENRAGGRIAPQKIWCVSNLFGRRHVPV